MTSEEEGTYPASLTDFYEGFPKASLQQHITTDTPLTFVVQEAAVLKVKHCQWVSIKSLILGLFLGFQWSYELYDPKLSLGRTQAACICLPFHPCQTVLQAPEKQGLEKGTRIWFL